MNMLSIILLLVGIMQTGCVNSAEKHGDIQCKCTDNTEPIISFRDRSTNELIFCGNLNDKLSDNKYLISGYKLINCSNGNAIFDESVNEVPKFIVSINDDSLQIAETHYILNEDWEINITPATEMTLKFVNGKLHISEARNVFLAPPLSKEQEDSLITLTENLKEKIKEGKSVYPYDEKSIYFLFMGAVNGDNDAKYLLQNLEQLFILDGAIAETKGEIWIDF